MTATPDTADVLARAPFRSRLPIDDAWPRQALRAGRYLRMEFFT